MSASVSTLALAAALGAAPAAQAAIYTFTGNTTGKPTYTRPLEDLSGISAVGVGVNYDVFTFTVNVTGSYTFLTTGEFDTFLTLYAGSFSPASPLTNAVVANDDIFPGPFTTSGFAVDLTVGTSYRLVTTGYESTEFGAYSTTIGGPGAVIAAIPEPKTYALMGLGLGLVGLLRRRDRAAND